jgi:hypothetical protein
MRWLRQQKLAVLVLDGTERLAAFPRLLVFPFEGGGGRWRACVAVAAGQREWLPGVFATEDEARRACLDSARIALSRRWRARIDAALADLPEVHIELPRVSRPAATPDAPALGLFAKMRALAAVRRPWSRRQ